MYRANYAVFQVQELLGPAADSLDVEWASFVGNSSSRFEFDLPAEGVRDAYVEFQVYEVGAYGHEIVVNDTPLSGFDIPPGDGWQYWMDALGDHPLVEGTNTLRLRRDTSSDDAFAVGNVVVHWRESSGGPD